ncbi:6-bladed beta-propeller [Echinicola sp. CAU 1574]|uniref:6-bladed beta-propeller n=1 Tax=Echinicola arenosa TaxID=2774144 RepID=A0ABR9AM03_9BACT|nr:6-bladed beta-propeller [Echinicola arenosa]MBD8489833.1 6-bladed beta-propeller [Echinicola arenosa]
MKYIFTYITFSLLLSACRSSSSEQNAENIISLENTKKLQAKNLEIINAIPLETTSENLMGNRLRIRKSSSHLYIMDEESKRKSLHVFAPTGNYIGKAIEEGEGPENIPSLDDFFIGSDGKLELLSTVGDMATIYQIDTSGSPNVKFKSEYVATSFTKLPNDEYLLCGGYNLPIIKNRVVKVSATGEIADTYLPNDYSGKLLPMTERNFFPSGDNVNFIESFDHQVYQYIGDSLTPIFEIDFGAYAIPSSYWDMDFMEGFSMLNEKGFGNITAIFQADLYTMIECMFQGPFGVYKQLLFLEDDKNSKYSIQINEDESPVFYYPIGIDQEGHFLFLTYQDSLKDYLAKSGQPFSFSLPESDFNFPVIISVSLTP